MSPKFLTLIALLAASLATSAMAQFSSPDTPPNSDRDRIKAERARMDAVMKAEPTARPWDGLKLLNPKIDPIASPGLDVPR